MWPNTFNKKCATISGWQCLGDFAAVKQQLQKIRASTRISSKKSEDGTSATRPLPPLPDHGGAGPQGNKSVRFALPDGAQGPNMSGSEGSDQGYESDQSRERRRQLELPGLLQKLAHLGQKSNQQENHYGHAGGQGGQAGQGGRGGTLNRYNHDDSLYYGPIKSIQESDRDLSTSSPVLLQLYDAVKVEPDASNKEDNVQAAIARLASSENLASSYDLVLGLVRRPQQSPRPCKHAPSTPPPSRHHCPCHNHNHHHCNSSRDRENRDTSERDSNRDRERDRERDSRRPLSRSRPTSPGPMTSSKSRSRPSSPGQQPTKSKWSFGRKAKRSASAERRPNQNVELGWGDMRPGVVGKWEDTGSRGWDNAKWEGSSDSHSAATTAQLAGDLCRRATALRRTLYKMPGLINQRHAFLEIIKDVASEMKLLLDAAGRLAPLLPEQQRVELDMARRKLLETSRSFSNALKGYFKEPKATPVLLAATALVYRTDEIIQALEP